MHTRSGIPVSAAERHLMEQALDEARTAGEAGEIPVGAILVDAHGTVIARAHNLREHSLDPTGHAEILALRAGSTTLGDRILTGCTLVVTLEPCVMCAGALAAARVSRVLFGAWDAKAGGAGSVYDILRDRRLPHPPIEVVGGVLERESEQLLRQFFEAKR